MDEGKLGIEMEFDACSPGGSVFITGGVLDRRRKLRVEELAVSVWTLSVSWKFSYGFAGIRLFRSGFLLNVCHRAAMSLLFCREQF